MTPTRDDLLCWLLEAGYVYPDEALANVSFCRALQIAYAKGTAIRADAAPADDNIAALLLTIYRTADEGRQWLASPQPLLNGERPTDLIARGERARVIGVLRSLIDGTYT